MDYLDYYWTTVRQIKPGTKFKLHPDHAGEYIRGYYYRSRRAFACEYKRGFVTCWRYLRCCTLVCVQKEATV